MCKMMEKKLGKKTFFCTFQRAALEEKFFAILGTCSPDNPCRHLGGGVQIPNHHLTPWGVRPTPNHLPQYRRASHSSLGIPPPPHNHTNVLAVPSSQLPKERGEALEAGGSAAGRLARRWADAPTGSWGCQQAGSALCLR